MRLFVVNERSPNPSDWSDWSWRAIVIADTEDDARMLVGDLASSRTPVTEVPMDSPLVLAEVDAPRGT